MTEIFYPTLDVPNSQSLQLVICAKGRCRTESEGTEHAMRVPDPRSLSFQQVNKSKDGSYVITKTYITDPKRPSVLIQFEISSAAQVEIYVAFDPSLGNSGMHDSSWCNGSALLAADGEIASALVSSSGFSDTTCGFLDTSDGVLQLTRYGSLREKFQRAENGNVVQVGRIGAARKFTLALGFGKTRQEALRTARVSLAKGFAQIQREFDSGWHAYLSSLRTVDGKYARQYHMSAMVLKALEDKTHRGAMAASPSVPWGGGPNANEATVSGYHAVWARDLYHVGTAFHAMGDTAAANRALNYLFTVQQKRDGSFPQNTWLDGRPIGGGVQMDQTAFAVLLAYQLNRTGPRVWSNHIKPAAEFLMRHGPSTNQDRWEEESGYSPSTIAAEIAALVCAAYIARANGDQISSSTYLARADEWARRIESLTRTTTGPFLHGKYFLRITQGDANAATGLEINSGGGLYDQRQIVDAGFLELVRLGIKKPDDPAIIDSLNVIDQLIRVETPQGAGWYRYNHDGYGERTDGKDYDGRTGRGRLWTLLAGERGQYELARGNFGGARASLAALMSFANDGLMIPEQVWDRPESPQPHLRFGKGTGSATPLAWSMAQFIRLALNIRAKRNLETPAIVRERYISN
jgi:glucoamylase